MSPGGQYSGNDLGDQTPVDVVISSQDNQGESQRYLTADRCKLLKRIAITQIVIGGMSVVFGIGIVCVPDRLIYRLQNQLLGTGIWDGLLFVITGIIGLSAANRNLRKKVVAAIVTNIFCACGGLILSLFAAFDLSINQLCTSRSQVTTTIQLPETTWHWSDETTAAEPTTAAVTTPVSGLDRDTTYFDFAHYQNCLSPEATNILFSLNALNALMGLIQTSLAIYCAVFCWRAVHGCSRCCGASEPPYLSISSIAQGYQHSSFNAAQLSLMPTDISSGPTDHNDQSNNQHQELPGIPYNYPI